MEIINIFLPYCRDGSVILTIKYNSGKCGNVQVKDGEIINFPLGDKVKTAVKSLIKKIVMRDLKRSIMKFLEKESLMMILSFCLRHLRIIWKNLKIYKKN